MMKARCGGEEGRGLWPGRKVGAASPILWRHREDRKYYLVHPVSDFMANVIFSNLFLQESTQTCNGLAACDYTECGQD